MIKTKIINLIKLFYNEQHNTHYYLFSFVNNFRNVISDILFNSIHRYELNLSENIIFVGFYLFN